MDHKVTKIYWTGFMAAGKSLLGRKLALELSWNFTDLDRIIERELGSIAEIFENRGEAFFRQKEAGFLRSIDIENAVIATGGGTAPFADNMKFMLDAGLVIFADTPFEIIWKRLLANDSPEKRPMAFMKSKEELRELYERRHPTYSKAHIAFRPEDDWDEFVKVAKFRLE